jgi:iron(III) transport system permease protein
LLNSILTAGLATVLATFFGLSAALALTAMAATARRVALIACVVALALPPFLVTNCWLHYLGGAGVWRAWLPLSIFGIGGVVWMLALMLWPIVALAACSAWRTLDTAHFEAEPELHGWHLVRWLLWPAARNATGCAAILIFVLALNQFSVPAILQVKVLPVEAWIQFSTALNAAQALAISWPLIVVPLIAIILLRNVDIRWSNETTTAASQTVRRQLGVGLFVSTVLVTGLLLSASVGLPLFQLLTNPRTWAELPRVWQASWPVAVNSAVFAAGASILAVGVAFLTWRTRLGGAFWLLFLWPGMLLAIAIICTLNRPVLEVVYRSFAVVILVLAMHYSGPVWALMRQAFRSVDAALLDAARLEGLTKWGIFRHVYWPRGAAAALAAGYACYLLCLWDVETITLLYPPGAETIALRVFNLLHYGHDAQVNALCLSLLVIAAAPATVYAAWAALRARPSL